MVKISIDIENADATGVAADLRHLLRCLDSGEYGKVPEIPISEGVTAVPETPAPVPTAPQEAAPASKTKTRKSKTAEPAPAPTPAAPVNPTAPVQPAVVPTPAPAPVTPTVPTSVAPAAVPTAPATFTLETLSRAGSSLVMAGRMADVMALLKQFGIQAITQLKPVDYPAFAAGLKALGAQI